MSLHQIEDNDSVVLIDDDDKEDDVSKPELQQQPNEETQPDRYITLSVECIAPNCSEMFVNQSQLDHHLFRVHSIKAFRCLAKDCARSFSSSRRLSIHLGKAHSDVTKWNCGQCSKHYESYDRLTKHTIEKHHRGRFGCSVSACEFVGLKRSKVKAHFKREHRQQPELCAELIVSDEERDDIVKPSKIARTDAAQAKDETSLNFITISLKCHQPNCPQMFTNKSLLYDHMLQGHSIQKHQCLIINCNQSFRDHQTLGHHIKQAHAHTTEWHCGQCPDKHYPTYHDLMFHTIRYHHLGQFQCSIPGCLYPIQNIRAKVNNHFVQVHKSDLVCGQPGCVYRTYSSSSSSLKRHEHVHLGIKPYRCKWPGCAYASTEPGNARAHIRNVHFNPKKTLLLDVEQLGQPKDYFEVLRELL